MKYIHPLTISMFAAVPYVLVTWGYVKLTDGDANAFWIALGLLLGIRFFFYIIETLGDVLCWRLYQRRIAVDNAITFFRSNGYPQREYQHDDIGNNLARIQDDHRYLPLLRNSAGALERTLTFIEGLGILVGARTWATFNAALDSYAPRSKATKVLP